jgi:hypothetical protein
MIGHNQPCRLCGNDDDDALIDSVAEDMWENRRRGTLDDWLWANVGDYDQ